MASVQDCLVSTTRLGRYLQRERTIGNDNGDASEVEKTAVKVEELLCRWPGNFGFCTANGRVRVGKPLVN